MSNVCPVCGNVVQDSAHACEMCGFKLIGTTQRFEPVKVAEEVSAPTSTQGAYQLRVLRGQQIGSVFTLTADVVSVGRNPQNDIFLNDMTVSRNHAELSKTSTSYRIKDDQSFNGVWVNGKSVDEALLKEGDLIQIGVFKLIFEKEHK